MQKLNILFEKFNNSRLATVLIFALIAIGFFFMNLWTPYQGDDYSFNFISAAEKCPERVGDIGDLFSSWGYHYMHGNGRFADDGCVRPTHFLGKNIFNFLNTAVFIGFIALLVKLANRPNFKVNANAVILSVVLFAFLMPIPWQTCLWQTGACNYLWASTAAIFWLFLFEKARRNSQEKTPWYLCVLAFFVSVICGWFHEGIAPVVSLCMGIYGVFNFKKLTKLEIALMLGFFIGTALVIFSPGIINRATSGNSMSIPPLTIANLIKATIAVASWSKVSLILITILAIIFIRSREFLKKIICSEWLYFSILFVAIAYNIFLRGAGGERNCFFSEAIATILILKLFSTWNFSSAKNIIVSFGTIAVVVGICFHFPKMIENKKLHDDFKTFAQSTTGIYINGSLPVTGENGRFVVVQHLSDANFGDHHNLAISRYYGRKDRVFIAPKKFFDLIFEKDLFCVPENELCSGWYTMPELSFAVKKLNSDNELKIKEEQIFTKIKMFPANDFIKNTVIPFRKTITGQDIVFERPYGDLSILRILEFPSGKYLAVPISNDIKIWKFIPAKTVEIKIKSVE